MSGLCKVTALVDILTMTLNFKSQFTTFKKKTTALALTPAPAYSQTSVPVGTQPSAPTLILPTTTAPPTLPAPPTPHPPFPAQASMVLTAPLHHQYAAPYHLLPLPLTFNQDPTQSYYSKNRVTSSINLAESYVFSQLFSEPYKKKHQPETLQHTRWTPAAKTTVLFSNPAFVYTLPYTPGPIATGFAPNGHTAMGASSLTKTSAPSPQVPINPPWLPTIRNPLPAPEPVPEAASEAPQAASPTEAPLPFLLPVLTPVLPPVPVGTAVPLGQTAPYPAGPQGWPESYPMVYFNNLLWALTNSTKDMKDMHYK